MADKRKNAENAILGSAAVHKTSAFGVNDGKWYIALCKSTRERTIRDRLLKANYQAYVASRVETRVYKSRNRRQVETIVIPSKIFIRTQESELPKILLAFPPIYKFMLNSAMANQYGGKPFAVVPDAEMQQLQYVLSNAENPILFTEEPLRLDQKVRILRGPLTGFEGHYIRQGKSSYIVLKMDLGATGYVMTEIPLNDIQPL